jgi:hypothetical protein
MNFNDIHHFPYRKKLYFLGGFICHLCHHPHFPAVFSGRGFPVPRGSQSSKPGWRSAFQVLRFDKWHRPPCLVYWIWHRHGLSYLNSILISINIIKYHGLLHLISINIMVYYIYYL